MKTRRAKPGSPFRQERYQSAPELQRGLLATCVASRCRILDDPEDRSLLWFLQRLSHVPGGFENAVREMIELWPDRFRTEKMRSLGTSASRKYSPGEASEIFKEITGQPCTPEPLKEGSAAYIYRLNFCSAAKDHICSLLEASEGGETFDYDPEKFYDQECERRDALLGSKINVSIFEHLCRNAALGIVEGTCGLADFLFKRVCIDPSLEPAAWRTWYLPELRQTLIDYQAVCIDRVSKGLALTTITEKVFEALDYSLDIQGLVLIQGLERRGKTFSAKAWCDLHPGEARYVKTPNSTDEVGFFREIAKSLGIASGQSMKTVQMRDRIEEVLSGGDLMLVMDNAHFLFGQSHYRNASPKRITWILTALVDEGIPVAFISTPQFTVSQQLTAERSKWRDAQLTGRIEHFEQLPEVLSDDDLAAVARVWLPDADAASVKVLVGYAKASDKYLQAIGSMAQRAIYLAKKQGREKPALKDIMEALESGVIPSDNALFAATESAKDQLNRRAGRKPSTTNRVRASRLHTADNEPPSLAQTGFAGPVERSANDGSIFIPDLKFGRKSGANLAMESAVMP